MSEQKPPFRNPGQVLVDFTLNGIRAQAAVDAAVIGSRLRLAERALEQALNVIPGSNWDARDPVQRGRAELRALRAELARHFEELGTRLEP